jgi:hypothetical protein
VTKQFNFYDFYGYLLPGVLLLGLFWLPSTAVDSAKRQRMPSDLLLDTNNSKFSKDVKERLSKQVRDLFGLDLGVTQDWDGGNDISKNRQSAFFQARSYLIAKKAAQYAEQYQGLYAMMRGLGVSFLAGAMYLAGWGLSFHRNSFCLSGGMPTLLWIASAVALISALVAFYHESAKKNADRILAGSLIVVVAGSGFLAGSWRFQSFGSSVPSNAEPLLWGSWLLALVAATRCFSAYRTFARTFAETVWLDFSAYRSFAAVPAPPVGDSSDES